MKLIINVDEKLVCEGFERTFTEEERDILIRAIGNGTPGEVELNKLKERFKEEGTHFAGLRGILGFVFKRYDENFEMLPGEYIVLLEYKYEHEEQFKYELNILCIDDKERYFLNDSYEGQEHFKILAYADLNSFSRERLENFSKYFLGGNTNV